MVNTESCGDDSHRNLFRYLVFRIRVLSVDPDSNYSNGKFFISTFF